MNSFRCGPRGDRPSHGGRPCGGGPRGRGRPYGGGPGSPNEI